MEITDRESTKQDNAPVSHSLATRDHDEGTLGNDVAFFQLDVCFRVAVALEVDDAHYTQSTS